MSGKGKIDDFCGNIVNDLNKEITKSIKSTRIKVQVVDNQAPMKFQNAEHAYWHYIHKYYHGKRFKDAFGTEKKYNTLIKDSDFTAAARRTITMVKLGVMAGKSVTEMCDDMQIKNRALVIKVLRASLEVVTNDINSLTPGDLFSQYALQKKDLVDRLKGQLDRIENFWRINNNNMLYHREYAGIIKVISDIQDTVMKTGTDLQVYRKEGEDRVINFNFGDNLMPDVAPLEAKQIENKSPDAAHVVGDVIVSANGKLNRSAEATALYSETEKSQAAAMIEDNLFHKTACVHFPERGHPEDLDLTDVPPEPENWDDE